MHSAVEVEHGTDRLLGCMHLNYAHLDLKQLKMALCRAHAAKGPCT
jgi:hypothetical protein